MIKKVDKENKFVSAFNSKTGEYVRTGILDVDMDEWFEKIKQMDLPFKTLFQELLKLDTGKDPFMTSFPELLDIGIMGSCHHGSSGLCVKAGVQCYQNGLGVKQPNMTIDNFRKIIDECKGKTFQVALGGRGDVDQHENFAEILKYCRKNGIVPNFTSSGLGFTPEIVELCKALCGAVAISWYRQEHTYKAIQMLINANVKTNIHYVLGRNSIDEAIKRLEKNDFPKGINAIIFLLHKPVGLGQEENILDIKDEKVKRFFQLIDSHRYDFKIGFDSCTVPGILNRTKNISPESIDTCEGGRWSAYITADMMMLPCSFDNQDLRWAYDISNNSIKDAWDSPQFDDFRNYFKESCTDCHEKEMCMGGCPIRRQIVLCDRREKELYESAFGLCN